MKKAGVLAASLAAAASSSVVAFNSDDNHSASTAYAPSSSSASSKSDPRGPSPKSPSRRAGEEKFAPRFDGLRFIETLVTAHR